MHFKFSPFIPHTYAQSAFHCAVDKEKKFSLTKHFYSVYILLWLNVYNMNKEEGKKEVYCNLTTGNNNNNNKTPLLPIAS